MSSAPAGREQPESPRSAVPRILFLVLLPLIVLVTAFFGLRAVVKVINGPQASTPAAPAPDSLPMPVPMAAPR
jgi:amino acid transporter